MVKCLCSKTKFLVKIIPIFSLTALKLFDYLKLSMSMLEGCGATIFALLCDNNRINQRCYNAMFEPIDKSKPWIVKHPCQPDSILFLLYDPVHILKNIRNNWLNEKTKTMFFFDDDGNLLEASWYPLISLYNHEKSLFSSNSKLTMASISPSKLERQKVALALQIFCDQTVAALRSSSIADGDSFTTADFISKIVSFWKLLNCKSVFESKRRNDPDRAVLDFSEAGQEAFEVLRKWSESEILPCRNKGRVREKTMSHDTSNAIVWTCKALIDLANYLLTPGSTYSHEYVRLGFYQQDDLERYFAHFRRSAGCNYFITTKEVFATFSLDKARLMLDVCEEDDFFEASSFHSCDLCREGDGKLSESQFNLLTELPEHLEGIATDDIQNLFYMSGYVAFKHDNLRGSGDDFESLDCSSFLQEMDRGKLSYPCEELFILIKLAFLFFTKTDEKLCRKKLIRILLEFPSFFFLDIFMCEKACSRIANIFFKRFSSNIGQEVYLSCKKSQSATLAKLSSKSSK